MILQHTTLHKSLSILYLFRVTFDFTAASRSKSWVVSVFLLLHVPQLYVNVRVGYCVPPDVTLYLPAIASQLRYFLRFKAVLLTRTSAETIME